MHNQVFFVKNCHENQGQMSKTFVQFMNDSDKLSVFPLPAIPS